MFNSSGNSFIRGVLTIENQATGYGFSDYMIGNLRRTEVARGVAILQFRATSQAYYADDTWKITPTLTLTVGLRYEFTQPWANKGDNLINAFVPFIDTVPNVTDLSRHPVLVRAGGGDPYENTLLRFNPAIQFVRDGRLGERLMQSDYNDFAPRLGMAWSPSNRWSIRAGAGVFYVQDQSNGERAPRARSAPVAPAACRTPGLEAC